MELTEEMYDQVTGKKKKKIKVLNKTMLDPWDMDDYFLEGL